jgi:succinate dehydrogenase flavoprotein subunit
MSKQHVVVVGGGLAGLAATMRLAEAGVHVYLVSMVPVKRSHSVCAQGGINSVNQLTRQQGDSEYLHLDDTVYGGDFLQHQPPVKEMCDWAPRVIDLLDRLGVPFNRSPEGMRDQRRFGGTMYKRTSFAGATTGQQLIYALDEQVRRWEAEGLVEKFEYWEFLDLIRDEGGTCRGVVVQDMFSMEIRPIAADAVVLATGGNGLIFGRSTMSMICTGGAAGRAFKAGAKYANGEFMQVHPTAIPGTDKLRLMSESARGEGGRVWVPKAPQDTRDPRTIPASERYYFLEERYPAYGNLVPRDIATREIFDVCVNQGLSVEQDKLCVYLDVTELDADTQKKLDGILEIYEKFQGVDPRIMPMKIFPAIHYTMGGLWVDYERNDKTGGLVEGSLRNHHSNLPGVFVIGEADYQYHGGNRLGANSLLSCIFSGLFVAPTIQNWLKASATAAEDQSVSLFEGAAQNHKQKMDELIRNQGDENPYKLHKELGDWMTRCVTVVRNNKDLASCLEKIGEFGERYKKVSLSDKGSWTNQSFSFARALGDMINIAKVITKGALQRDECRGAHYKPEFQIKPPHADAPDELQKQATAWCEAFGKKNKKWLKSTIAEYTPDGPKLTYEEVDTSLVPVRPRTYGLKGAEIIEKTWKDMTAGDAPKKVVTA